MILHITIRNNTSKSLNLAFWFVTPVNYKNALPPGATWRSRMSSALYSFEAREDTSNNLFSPSDSWSKFGTIAGATVAGAASVLIGGLSLAGGLPDVGSGMTAASKLKDVARAGRAAYVKKADGHMLHVGKVGIPFHKKQYAIRVVGGRYQLWDEDKKRVLA